MFVKNPYSLLVEAASIDLQANTAGVMTESQILSRMNDFEEASEDVVVTAEMVTVIKLDGDYLTEMSSLYPYMQTNGIKSVAEALNSVAASNGLPEKSVGLLIESDSYINSLLEKADAKCKKDGDKNAKNKVLDNIKKATDLPAKLKKDGFKIKKKKSNIKECDTALTEEMKTAADFHKKKKDEAYQKDRDLMRMGQRGDATGLGRQSERELSRNPEYKKRIKDNPERTEFGYSKEAEKINKERHDSASKALDRVKKSTEANGSSAMNYDAGQATSATMRHDRRHGTKESYDFFSDVELD